MRYANVRLKKVSIYAAFRVSQLPIFLILREEFLYMVKNYAEPDKNHQLNYMFDTSAYNHIIESNDKMDAVKKSILYGFRYYSTALQDMELSGKGAKTYNRECIPNMKYSIPMEMKQKFDIVDKELNIQLIPEIASCMRNHSRLDGTIRFLSPESLTGRLYQEIVSKNKPDSNRPFEYSYDAMIAESAIYYGCFLVSDDKELRDTVNSFYPKRAITTEELLEIIMHTIDGYS